LEILPLGSRGSGSRRSTNLDAGRYPHLTAAAQASTLDAGQLFVAAVHAFLDGAIAGPI
jgi:hypothetical protein